jgi:hypothetical protein
MLRADSAKVDWDTSKKQWLVHVKIGEEVIRRPLPKTPQTAAEDTLKNLAVETANADGYEVDLGNVAVVR